MCAPIPKGKWAWKYDSCVKCGTKRIKHKGRGLCLHCFDKERGRNPKRKESTKKRHADWYLKVKSNPELLKRYRKDCRLRGIKWRKNSKSPYRLWLGKRYKVLKFERFLNPKRTVKRDLGGIKFRCEGCEKECLITSAIKPNEIKERMNDFELFKKTVIKNCAFKKEIKEPPLREAGNFTTFVFH